MLGALSRAMLRLAFHSSHTVCDDVRPGEVGRSIRSVVIPATRVPLRLEPARTVEPVWPEALR